MTELIERLRQSNTNGKLCDEAADTLEHLTAERDALKAQLPAEMQDCTIQFKQCEKGHGWLTATNWVQHGCLVCERDALKANAERLHNALVWISTVNAMDYEYQAKAKAAIAGEKK